MATRGDAAKHAAVGRDRQSPIGAIAEEPALRLAGGVGQHKAGEAKSKRRLADAARPAEQQGMWQPAAVEQPAQLRLGGSMAEQIGVGAWRRRGRRLHRKRCVAATHHSSSVTLSRAATVASTAR